VEQHGHYLLICVKANQQKLLNYYKIKLQTYTEVKKWIFAYPEESHTVLQKLTDVLKVYMDN